MKTFRLKLLPELVVLVSLNTFAGTLYVDLNCSSPTSPYLTWTTAATNIQDAVDVAVAGDLVLVTNGVYRTGGRVVFGAMTNRVAVTKPITLQSVNGPQSTLILGRLGAGGPAMRCVWLVNGAVLSGFTLTNGATMATGNDSFERSGGALRCESSGAVVSICVIVGNRASRSGGGVFYGTLNNCTIIRNNAYEGAGASGAVLNNCSLITNVASGTGGGAFGCSLNGCSLIGNSASSGGGTKYGSLNRCTLVGNRATFGGGASGGVVNQCIVNGNSATSQGGGVDGCWVSNSTLIGNTALVEGGGARSSELKNCTLTGNSAESMGGGVAFLSLFYNCIVYFNTAPVGVSYDASTTLNFSCTEPQPPNGFGNLTHGPQFLAVSLGDLRLQSNSPCINGGRNSYVSSTSDMDGNPRVVRGSVDMGAYEVQLPGSTLAYAWAQRYGLPTDGSVDFTDSDGDGVDNWQESYADSNPTNGLSVLRMVSATGSPGGDLVTWQSVSTRSYWLERATDLGAASPFQIISNNIAGASGTKTVKDPTATNAGPYSYRVGVQ